ncbi:MAG: 2-C-methyl-D-erythritol 2,4-cyclodiphosphate synthase [Burkholderiaceae bacterium]|nr:2-C-methyl-D-erythritol 2,4-cyclodiphosphate synthase [Microbacteriaceae bacterium]
MSRPTRSAPRPCSTRSSRRRLLRPGTSRSRSPGGASVIGIIVVAAGSGTRLGRDLPKALVAVAGRTILEHALYSVFGMEEEARVVVVAPADQLAEAEAIARAVAGVAHDSVTVVAGGATRQESVAAGLAALDAAADPVLVHDAARSFTPSAQFALVSAAVAATGAGVIPVLAVTDTIKEADAAGRVIRTVDRSSLVAVQTPQGFPRAELDAAYAGATVEYTDDAALFAAAGHDVTTVAGSALAFKITTPWDLRRAESLQSESRQSESRQSESPRSGSDRRVTTDIRSGIGIDVHAVDPDAPLWLGGLFWPGEPGLAGHSDGDAICHAVCDALLSAAGLGDIGGLFGTSDPELAGAHGDVFVRRTIEQVTGAGFRIVNVAVQVVARRPKLSGRRLEIETLLSGLVGAPVSVSATTTDGLGFTGRGDGVAVVTTALVESSR